MTYTHVQGCFGNVPGSCLDGMGCGNINCNNCHDCSGHACTLTKCMELAEDNDADGFAYRRSAGQFCRLCTFSELTNYESETDFGIYSRICTQYLFFPAIVDSTMQIHLFGLEPFHNYSLKDNKNLS